MEVLFYLAVMGVLVLAFRPLKEAAAYRFRNPKLVLEGLFYVLLGLLAIFYGSWWPLIIAGIVAVILHRQRSR